MTASMKSRWLRNNWSDLERRAFERALETGDGLSEPGLGAEWSERTREHMEFGYGRYREFCVRSGRVVEFANFHDIFRMDWIKAYYHELQTRLAPRTVLKALVDLSMSIRAMAPEVDRSQLIRVCSKIERTAQRTKNIKDSLVPPPASLALARDLIARARASRFQGKNAAAIFRDGVIHAPVKARLFAPAVSRATSAFRSTRP